jgi:hypothetical protein
MSANLDCRREAAECLSLAEAEMHQPLKVALTEVARSWLTLASQLEQLEALTDRKTAVARRTAMIAQARQWLSKRVASA